MLIYQGASTGDGCTPYVAGGRMRRGEPWLAVVDKMRPVLVVSSFTELNHVRVMATTRIRDLATEVVVGRAKGMKRVCVLNAQQFQLVPREAFSLRLGHLDADKLANVCCAIIEAVGC